MRRKLSWDSSLLRLIGQYYCPGAASHTNLKERDDNQLIQKLQWLVEKHPAIGFWSCCYR
ncbi:hypothetical protein [Adhaeribacter aquaticus]|uniref:hypothetical protein n=1 Tax=Adhaeribacter aquaticus TaxID=299567 RepID=UPI000420EA76|nr:hypothetical protein [Adhaeribacter aquaticus]